jgi:transposase
VDSAVHGDIWRCGVGEGLGPTWHPGAMVLWDNRAAHNVAGVDGRITARGARLIWLSPYSPDCNPSEPCWSTLKTRRRQAKARTVEGVIDAINHALDTITEADIRGWFAPCGYPVH